MFTVEHDFDASVITLIDELQGETRPLLEDVVITAFDDRVVVEQMVATDSAEVLRITLSLTQLADLRAALDLPEGSYRLAQPAGSRR